MTQDTPAPAEPIHFRWARIGNNGPEPVVVVGKRGARKVYTFKCPDAFDPDEPDAAIKLGGKIDVPYEELTAEEQAREDKLSIRRERAYRARHGHHGYSGFGGLPHAE